MGEAAAHLVFDAKDHSDHARGADQRYTIDPADKAGSHRRSLAAMAQRGGHQLGTELQLDTCAFLDATDGRTGKDLLPWHRRSPLHHHDLPADR